MKFNFGNKAVELNTSSKLFGGEKASRLVRNEICEKEYVDDITGPYYYNKPTGTFGIYDGNKLICKTNTGLVEKLTDALILVYNYGEESLPYLDIKLYSENKKDIKSYYVKGIEKMMNEGKIDSSKAQEKMDNFKKADEMIDKEYENYIINYLGREL